MKIRVLYVSTPAFGVPTLKTLAADPRFEVVGVVTQPDKPAGRGLKPRPPAIKIAAEALNLTVLQPPTLLTPEAQAEISALKPDVGAVAAYGQWIPAEVFDLPLKRSLNLHPSLLPRHRGAAPVLSTILEGDDKVGLSVLFVEDEMDAGDLLAQMSIPVENDDTTGSLMARLAEIGAPLFVETLAGWVGGEITPIVQDHSLSNWIGRLEKDFGRVDWSRSAEEIARRCRACDPWPGTFTFLGDKRLLIHGARAIPDSAAHHVQGEPGTIIRSTLGIAVITGDGLLKLEQVQLESRQRLDIKDFSQGQRHFIGTILN